MSNESPPHAAFLATPEVREAIGKALRRRSVRAVDAEDLTHDVIERALRTSQPPPTLQECVALVRKIATDLAIDKFKIDRGRAKYDAGPYENPDDAPARAAQSGEERDPIDARRQLDVVRQQIESGNITARQASILARDAQDTPHAEIASQLQLAPQTVRNELGAARRTARQSWATYLAAALFTSVALLLWFQRRPEPVAAHYPQSYAAKEERQKALGACDRQLWQDCLAGLARAAELDPAGDSDPRVQQARAEARKHLAEPPNQDKTPLGPGEAPGK